MITLQHSGGSWGATALTPTNVSSNVPLSVQQNVAQLMQMLASLANAERNLRAAFTNLTSAAQDTGTLASGIIADYNDLVQRVNVLNTQALDVLQTLPGIPLPKKPSFIPAIKAPVAADPATPVPLANLQWIIAADCGLAGPKAKVAEEAAEKIAEKVPWMDFLVKGGKVLAVATGAAAAGAFAIKMTNAIQAGSIAAANRAATDADVQKQATKIYNDTQDRCLQAGGDPTACTKNALSAYTTFIKNARQSSDGGSGGIGFFGWLGIAVGLVATAVVVQRYRAGAFPFAPHAHHYTPRIASRAPTGDFDDED